MTITTISLMSGDFHMIFITGKPSGYDRVRNAEIGNKDFELDVLEEAYTTGLHH